MAQLLTTNRIFFSYGLAIASWAGNKGWAQYSTTKEPVSRAEYFASSIVISGSFQMTKAPDNLSKWPLLKPGDMPKIVCPGFIPGEYTYSAMEDSSMEYCVSTANANGITDYAKFLSEPVSPGEIFVPNRHILIVATGELNVGGKICKAPFIAHARKLEGFTGTMSGKGMKVFRPS